MKAEWPGQNATIRAAHFCLLLSAFCLETPFTLHLHSSSLWCTLFPVRIAMNRTLESLLRFVNLTTSGLLAGSLGFGEAALVPGWQAELPRFHSWRDRMTPDHLRQINYFNAIGPVALGTAVTLAVGMRDVKPLKRVLDAAAVLGLAGVLASTIMVTVPINKELEAQAPTDYPRDPSQSLARNWSRPPAVPPPLGFPPFLSPAPPTPPH